MKKKIALLLCFVFIIQLQFVGCKKAPDADVSQLKDNEITNGLVENLDPGKKEDEKKEESTILTVNDLKNNYTTSETYEEPMYGLKKEEVISCPVQFTPPEGAELTEYANVYLDSNLTIPAGTEVSYDSNTQKINLTPPRKPVYQPVTKMFSIVKNEGWGYANTYYLAYFYDLKTGEKLEKPQITIFTIERELKSPFLKYEIKDGNIRYYWDEIPGAVEYVLSFVKKEETQFDFLSFKKVADLEYIDKDILEMGVHKLINFKYRLNDDNDLNLYYVTVMAIDKDGNASNASNMISIDSFRNQLPFRALSLTEEGVSSIADQINLLGNRRLVEMCDGSTVLYTVTYDIEHARITQLSDIVFNLEGEDRTLLALDSYIDGTDLKLISLVKNFDEATMESELKLLYEQTQASKGNAGVMNTPEFTLIEEDDTKESSVVSPTEDEIIVKNDNFPVFASSALTEYLARHMLLNEEIISLKDFKEASDIDLLWDSLYEAIYQNPLILGVSSFQYNRFSKTLMIEYEQDRAEQEKKQEEIKKEVIRVVNEIITPQMTDIEKEFAINQYLCDIAEYDTAALDNAMENNFIPDSSFRDSFTPYGVLINKRGVCASYAAAFKLLAEQAGLNCLVITGNLNGNLPHAWNRVLVDNEWKTVDSTNNDNEELFNALLNLPDSVAAKVLVEDDRYISNQKYGDFTSVKEDAEYYRVSNQYFSKSTIADSLAKELLATGTVTLRTDYDLSDEEFNDIVLSVIETAKLENKLDKLYGGYWLGVIYLSINN
ncbi:transglutaminase domain-containing protein [Lachnoclostridium phytofermentans]|uniref:Transglutaminase domain protein n=1 Tax=Lachnoclostridium phytofermentans (strain ATCC 700394 / DSM 18823 / ISDg) TaxID=357809 RepID=A9KJ77_LACP7|nr:transglutaminase domain-containing protein [Lachnoclostridium phytofermentans]ABX42489.1 transglutaminase domain protein [Lachnoclostridium phytofermentans ISDg]